MGANLFGGGRPHKTLTSMQSRMDSGISYRLDKLRSELEGMLSK